MQLIVLDFTGMTLLMLSSQFPPPSSGADIKNVVNQAALRAAADLVDSVTMKHLESARDKVLMGELWRASYPYH